MAGGRKFACIIFQSALCIRRKWCCRSIYVRVIWCSKLYKMKLLIRYYNSWQIELLDLIIHYISSIMVLSSLFNCSHSERYCVISEFYGHMWTWPDYYMKSMGQLVVHIFYMNQVSYGFPGDRTLLLSHAEKCPWSPYFTRVINNFHKFHLNKQYFVIHWI